MESFPIPAPAFNGNSRVVPPGNAFDWLRQGWALFAAVWALAAVGIVFKLYSTGRFRLFSTLVYVAMGWLVLFAIQPVWAALDGWTLGWLFAGGIAYTAGTFFYHRKIPYAHALWHVFVLLGSVCHFVAIGLYVLVPGA